MGGWCGDFFADKPIARDPSITKIAGYAILS